MRVGERGCQLLGSACLLFPILGFSRLPVRSPTAWTFREYSHSSYYYIVQFHWICPSIRDVDSHHSVSQGSRANRVQRPPPAPPRCGRVIPWLTNGCAQSHPLLGSLTPPEEARTPRRDCYAKDHRDPNHISKTVPPTVHLGPPNWTKSRTF